ncbi:MAG: hypothetical protein V4467_04060 [Patescibacteria group bacterium]
METEKKVTSHAIGTIFVKVRADGEVEAAAMHYTKREKRTKQLRTTLRLPMGKGKKVERESLTETQVREAVQECAKIPADFDYEFEFRGLVYYAVVPDDDNGDSELHLKAFMVARLKKGELRDYQANEQEYDPDTGKPIPDEVEILGPLKWYEIREVLNEMARQGNGLYVHTTAVLATLVALAGKYPKVEARYGGIVNRPDVQQRVAISANYRDEVKAYVGSLQAT